MRGRRAILYFYFNGHWDGLYGHARRLGIPIATIDTRVHRYGNTPESREKILAPCHLHRAQKFLWMGEWGTVYEHGTRLGLSQSTIMTRINRYGISKETIPIILHRGRLGKHGRVIHEESDTYESKPCVSKRKTHGYGRISDFTKKSLRSLGIVI